MDLPISGETRDEIARILEQVAKEGLDHPRTLDAAIDAIGAALQGEEVYRITVPGQVKDGDVVYYVSGDEWTDDEGAKLQRGHFVAVTE